MPTIGDFIVSIVGGELVGKLTGEPHLKAAKLMFDAGVAVIAYEEEQSLKKAQELMGCRHLKICPANWGTPTSRVMETAYQEQACAFLFELTPLWHHQPNINVGRLHAAPMRYQKLTNTIGTGKGPLEKCDKCR